MLCGFKTRINFGSTTQLTKTKKFGKWLEMWPIALLTLIVSSGRQDVWHVICHCSLAISFQTNHSTSFQGQCQIHLILVPILV